MNCLSRTLRAKRWWYLSGMLLITAVTVGRAAEPLAVVSLKATNDLVSDIEYLLEATGTSGFGAMILPQVKGYLQGIDGQKPIGLAVTVDGNDIRPMGFLPVSNLKAVLTQLPMLGEANDLGDGVLELQGPQPIFVKEKGGWAYIGQSAESLQQVPADPAKALDGLDKQYDLAIRAYIQNLPEQYKQLALSQIKAGLEQGLQNDQDPNARVMAEAQVAQLTQVIEEANQLTLGWRIDPQERQTYLDVSMTARPGTKLATQMASNREAKTDFAGFLAKDAAITLNMAGVIPSEEIPQTLATLDNVEKSALREIDQDEDLPDQAARDAAKRLVTTFFGIAKSTIETGKMDSCTSVMLQDKAMTVLSAAHVASGSEVETAVKQLVEIAKGQPDMTFSNVKFNADKHAGVSFHTLSLPIPEEEYARRVLGTELNIVVGTGETTAYLALGTDGINHLKRMIDASAQAPGQAVEPFQAMVALGTIMKFAASVEPDNPGISALAATLAQANGKDHILIRTMPIPDGITYRFLLEEGVLKTIGQAAMEFNSSQGF